MARCAPAAPQLLVHTLVTVRNVATPERIRVATRATGEFRALGP